LRVSAGAAASFLLLSLFPQCARLLLLHLLLLLLLLLLPQTARDAQGQVQSFKLRRPNNGFTRVTRTRQDVRGRLRLAGVG
jgi:hypothetical protein